MEKALEHYKGTLESEREKLVEAISKAEKPEDFGSDVDDYDEEKNEAENFGNQLALAQELKTRLADVEAALERIAAGTYGTCAACGKKIEEEVLEASPESKLCKQCKKQKSR